MALAATLLGHDRPDRPETVYGVLLHLTPNPTRTDLQFEVQRAPDLSGAPDTGNAVSLASTVGPFPLTGGRFMDALPNDGARRWYRIRHVGDSVDASAWTGWVSSPPYRVPISRWRPIATHAPFDGMAVTSSWHKPQGSVLPIPSASVFLTFSTSSTAGVQIQVTQSVDQTIYYPDGTTATLKNTSDTATYPNAPAPTLAAVAGGAKAATTVQVRIGYVKNLGVGTGLGRTPIYGISANAAIAVANNQLVKVTSPAAVAGFVGYVVLANRGGAAGSEYLQLANNGADSATPFGTDWTEPTTALLTTQQYNAQWANAIVFVGLIASTNYYFYPYLDLADNRLTFATTGDFPNEGQNPSTARAVIQNQDGHIPLSSGAAKQPTPASGNVPTTGPAATNSGTGGGTARLL